MLATLLLELVLTAVSLTVSAYPNPSAGDHSDPFHSYPIDPNPINPIAASHNLRLIIW